MKNKCIVISIYNNKGGCGKSTFCINLCNSLATDFKKPDGTNYNVLAIDNDGQSNTSLILLKLSEDEIAETVENTMFEMITNEDLTAENCIIHTKYKNVDIIAATDDHNDTPDAISSYLENTRILKEKIQSIKANYDFIIIDCAANKDRNIYNALFAADVVISPVGAQLFSRIGLRNLLKEVNKVNRKREKPLLHYVFLSMVDRRKKHKTLKCKNDLKEVLGNDFIDKSISLLDLYSESFEQGYTAIDYPKGAVGRAEIKELTDAILNKISEELI